MSTGLLPIIGLFATGSGNLSNCPESRSGYDRATGTGHGRATGSGNISNCPESRSGYDRATGSGRPAGFGNISSCPESRSGDDRATGLGSFRATGSGNISNCQEPHSGYDRATGSGYGRTTGLGNISHCHWLFYFGWVCHPNRGYITLYTILRGFYFCQDRSSSLSVGGCGVDCFLDIFQGIKFSARAERGVTMVFWTPHVRALRFPLGTD